MARDISPTDRRGYERPAIGDDWADAWDGLVEDSDELAVERGPIADRPTTGAYDDELYLATDQRTLWRWDGAASDWEAQAGLGTASDPVPGTSHFESVNTNILESDWVTDAANYSDLQTALNQPDGTTGTVVMPPGQYIQSSTLTVPGGVALIGLTNPKNTPRPQIIGAGGVDPVVTTDSNNSHTISRVRIEPDSTEDAFNGSLRFGELSYCDCLGDIVVSDSDNKSGSGGVFGNLLGGNNITADSGVSSTCLIAHNRNVGTITSNTATEGTNS